MRQLPRPTARIRRPHDRLVVLITVVGGCGGPRSGTVPSSVAGDVNPERAYLTLEQIEPVPPPPQRGPVPERAARSSALCRRAEELYAQQRYTEAALELERALRRDPQDFHIHKSLALVLRASGSRERTRAHTKRALELYPDDVGLHYVLGRLALDDGHADEAITHLRTALACSNLSSTPDFAALTHFALGTALAEEGYLTAAIEQLQAYARVVAGLPEDTAVDRELATLRQTDGGRVFETIAGAHEKLGRFKQAATALARALEQRPGDIDLRVRHARALARAGQVDRALAEARVIAETDDAGIAVLVEVHESAGDSEGMLADLRQLTAAHPRRNALFVAYVDALDKQGRRRESEQAWRGRIAQRPDDIEAYRRLGDLLQRQGSYTEMLSIAAQAIARQPSTASQTRERVVAASTRPDADAALRTAVTQDPQQIDDHATAFLLGAIALHRGEAERGTAWLERCVSLAPDFLPGRIALAEHHLDDCAWEAARTTVTAGADPEVTENPSIQRLLGEVFVGLDDLEQAAAHFSEALRLDRNDAASARALGDVYRRLGKTLRARRQYQRAVEIDPRDFRARQALVELFLAEGLNGEAMKQLNDMQKLDAGRTAMARCRVLIQVGSGVRDYESLRAILTEAISADGPDADTLYWVAKTYFDERRFDQARIALVDALELDPRHEAGAGLLVQTYLSVLEFDAAADLLRRRLQCHPQRRSAIDGLVQVLLIMQRTDDALALLSAQIERHWQDPETLVRYQRKLLGELELARRFDEQIATIHQWQERDPELDLYGAWLVEGYLAAERAGDAIPIANQRLADDPHDNNRRQLLLQALLADGQYARAQQLALSWITEDRHSRVLYRMFMLSLLEADRFDDAVELVESATAADPRPEEQELVIQVLRAARRHAEAAERLDKLLTEQLRKRHDRPFSVHVLRRQIASELISAERYADAQARLNRWSENAESPEERFDFLRLLYLCRQEMGQHALALETLRRAHALAPNDVGVNNDLGYSWADAGLELNKAEQMVRYAVAAEPRNAAYLDSLGWVYYKKGDFDRAHRWLTLAAGAIGGRDPVINDHLGDVKWRRGQQDRALAHWREALRLATERREESRNSIDDERIIESTRQKIRRVDAGDRPPVAPLRAKATPTDGAE